MDFDSLQRMYLDPANLTDSGSEADTPTPRPHSHRYTIRHVTQLCPLTAAHRTRFLRSLGEEEIFRSELGSTLLCRFLHFSQALLRPLLPRPDPP